MGDYILWYAKAKDGLKYHQLYLSKTSSNLKTGDYRYVRLSSGETRLMTAAEKSEEEAIPDGARVYRLDNTVSQGAASEPQPFTLNGKTYTPGEGKHWKASYPIGMQRLSWAGRLHQRENSLAYVRFLDDLSMLEVSATWTDTSIAGRKGGKIYVVQTNEKVIERCILMTTDPGDLVFDPTCGSGTTAFVAEQWGRRWITCDTSRVAIALARTRMLTARYRYYLLADSEQGVKKEAEITGKPIPQLAPSDDIRKGFVCERVPHVTLKSIANNLEITEGMAADTLLAAIQRHAGIATLFDRPYQDSKRVRVCGQFSVESLSPHRVLAADEDRPAAESSTGDFSGPGQFEAMIIENLRKAGVQNTVKNERLKFERLEHYAGLFLHAVGEYTESNKAKRVAVCIGPEHGTVGPELIKEAAKEAVQGVGFDLLLVCGFAFDPHVSEETKRYGKLTVLTTRMNPDLAMGDELLKKTGAGNLFMIFGEPDLDIKKSKDKLTIEIRGLDVYDPTTGQIRSHSTDDIACWFIDTNYNGESFFVRHAYFTGADEPYEKLKRALRAEIDEAAWSALYSTKSRPFDIPKTGKIAVKVINHYGDEVLKVYPV